MKWGKKGVAKGVMGGVVFNSLDIVFDYILL